MHVTLVIYPSVGDQKILPNYLKYLLIYLSLEVSKTMPISHVFFKIKNLFFDNSLISLYNYFEKLAELIFAHHVTSNFTVKDTNMSRHKFMLFLQPLSILNSQGFKKPRMAPFLVM